MPRPRPAGTEEPEHRPRPRQDRRARRRLLRPPGRGVEDRLLYRPAEQPPRGGAQLRSGPDAPEATLSERTGSPMFPPRELQMALLAAAIVAQTALARPSTDPTGDDVSWVLANPELIIRFDVKRLMASELMKKNGIDTLKTAIEKDEKARELLKALGLDLTRDIDSVVISAAEVGIRSPRGIKGRVVIRGRFDPDKITETLRRHAESSDEVKLLKEGSTQLFEFKTKYDQKLYGAFVDRNTVVLTHDRETTADLARGPAKGGELSPEMKEAVGGFYGFTGKESVTLALVLNDELRKGLAGMKGAEVAGKLQTVTAGLTLTDVVTLKVACCTPDIQTAAQLRNLLRAGKETVSAIELPGEIQLVVDALLKELTIYSTGYYVTLNLAVSRETIDKIEKTVKEKWKKEAEAEEKRKHEAEQRRKDQEAEEQERKKREAEEQERKKRHEEKLQRLAELRKKISEYKATRPPAPRNDLPRGLIKEFTRGCVIGNRSSKVYHLPGTQYYEKMKTSRNAVFFETEEDAKRAKYHKAGGGK